jgi:SPP1 gp7 family putative phage head morphogenesis protein
MPTLELRVRAVRRRRPPSRSRAPRAPRSIGQEFARELIAMLREAQAEAAPLLEAAVRRMAAPEGSPTLARADAVDPVVEGQVRGIRVILTEKFSSKNTRPAVLRARRKVGKFNSRDLSRILRVDVSADLGLEAVVSEFVRENLRLVRGMTDRVSRELEQALTVNVGMRHEDLAKLVAERFQVGESRAAVIARDQTLKVNAKLHRIRQQSAGVTKYQWVSSGDERVRDEHVEADGQVFSWAVPPAVTGGYHPGEDIFCRCTALPILPGSPEDLAESD